MISLYIVLKELVIYCSGITNHCIQLPFTDINFLITGGFVELIFEITGLIRIFRNRDRNLKEMEKSGRIDP